MVECLLCGFTGTAHQVGEGSCLLDGVERIKALTTVYKAAKLVIGKNITRPDVYLMARDQAKYDLAVALAAMELSPGWKSS